MTTAFEVEVNQSYVESLGDTFLDCRGGNEYSKSEPFIERVREEVIDSKVIDEFRCGWRTRARIGVELDTAASFTECCSNLFLRDKITSRQLSDFTLPLQVPALQLFKQQHIDQLSRNVPVEVRQRHSEYISPLYDAVDGALSIEEILSLLFDGFVKQVKPLGRNHVDSEYVTQDLRKTIRERDDIDDSHSFFYQGPEHLGVLEHHVEKGIKTCICENGNSESGKGSYLLPIAPSEEDPVNYPLMKAVNELVDN